MDRSPQRKQGIIARHRVPCLRVGLQPCPLGVFTALVCIAALGCGKDDGRIDVYPTSGKVLVNGQPADGARVVFYPKAPETEGTPMPIPSGTTDSTGEYHLESYEPKDGAPAGTYSVTVIWLEPPPANAEELGVYDEKDRLQGRYSDPSKTTLTAKVEDGGGEIPPFDLK